VIVANTFVERWEVEPYLKMAEQCNARIEILTCRDEYQNIHGVPQETIERMRDKWQENVN
jgi:hypothetical protein